MLCNSGQAITREENRTLIYFAILENKPNPRKPLTARLNVNECIARKVTECLIKWLYIKYVLVTLKTLHLGVNFCESVPLVHDSNIRCFSCHATIDDRDGVACSTKQISIGANVEGGLLKKK